MGGGPINQKHFQNLQEKDHIIQQLFQETQALRRALHHREVYEHFISASLQGALANPELIKKMSKDEELKPQQLFEGVAIIAEGCATAMVRLLTEKETLRKKAHDEAVAKEEAEAKAKAAADKVVPPPAPGTTPLVGPDGKVIPSTVPPNA